MVFSWQGSPVICQDNSACSHELLQLTRTQITHPLMEWSRSVFWTTEIITDTRPTNIHSDQQAGQMRAETSAPVQRGNFSTTRFDILYTDAMTIAITISI